MASSTRVSGRRSTAKKASPLRPAGASKKGAAAGRTSKRRQGRPQNPEEAVGRDALIAATRELLKTKSPAKLTRTEIARYAGVDPGLVRYYFGKTSHLLAEVVQQVITEMRVARRTRADFKEVEERLEHRIADAVRLFQGNPFLHQIVIELIFSGVQPRAREMWQKETIAPALEEWSAVIDKGVEEGKFRRVDPRFMQVLVIAAGEFYATGRSLLEDMFGADAVDGDLERAYIEFVRDIMLYGLVRRDK